MKEFDPRNDTSVFLIKEYFNKEIPDGSGEIRDGYADCVQLLSKALKEINTLRHRLEIDRYYVRDVNTAESELVHSKDNLMLGVGDKISCLLSLIHI